MGMNIGAKNYNDSAYQKELSRMNIVILGFYRGWNPNKSENPIQKVVANLKSLNPSLKIGQYTVLNESNNNYRDSAKKDIRDKLNSHGWWLLNASGGKVQWTHKYNAWEINFTNWAPADENGQRYPQWRAERDYQVFFQPVPEFDIWYLDNIMHKPRVKADWDSDGVDDDPSDPRILAAWRARLSGALGTYPGNCSGTAFDGQHGWRSLGARMARAAGWCISRRAYG